MKVSKDHSAICYSKTQITKQIKHKKTYKVMHIQRMDALKSLSDPLLIHFAKLEQEQHLQHMVIVQIK